MINLTPDYFHARPDVFLADVLNITLHDKAIDMLFSVRDHKNTCVKGCHNSGKTFIAAGIMHWWLCTVEDAIVITTAPKEDLVRDLIWRDFRDQYAQFRSRNPTRRLYPVDPNLTELNIGEKWYARGMTARADNAAFFQGFHTRGRVLYIIDEGSGVDPMFFDARTRITPNRDDRFLVIGNPYPSNTAFHACFKSRFFHPITISAFDTPNVIHNKRMIAGMITREGVDDWREEFGEDTPFWKTRVLAEFHEDGDFGLIPLSWYDLAIKRWLAQKDRVHDDKARRVVGADVAEGGDAKSIACPMIDNYVEKFEVYNDPDTTNFGNHLVGTYASRGYVVVVDSIGVGAGTSSTVRHSGKSMIAYKGSERTDEHDRTGELLFANVRSLAFWMLRESLNPMNPDAIALPPDESGELREELTNIKYREVAGGRIQIEPKEKMIKRLGRSPDKADALVMANYGRRRSVKFAKIADTHRPVPHQQDTIEEIFNAPPAATW